MQVKIGENQFPLIIKDDGEFISEHTNRPLRWMEVSFRVFGEEIFKETRKKSQVTVIDNGEESIWKVNELSHRYTQGKPHYDLVWELAETENLSIETLILGDFEGKPYLYQEEITDGSLYITALVKLTPNEFEKLKSVYFGDIYFPVIRQGINDEPREMRFGKIIWSKDEETIKFKIYLVDKKHDDNRGNRLGLLSPEMDNIQNMLAANVERFVALLNLLEKKNLLTSDEIKQVEEISDENFNSRYLEFERVSDIDKYSIEEE